MYSLGKLMACNHSACPVFIEPLNGCVERGHKAPQQIMLPRDPSRLALGTCRDGSPTPSLCNLLCGCCLVPGEP